jgi:hypothetical protein
MLDCIGFFSVKRGGEFVGVGATALLSNWGARPTLWQKTDVGRKNRNASHKDGTPCNMKGYCRCIRRLFMPIVNVLSAKRIPCPVNYHTDGNGHDMNKGGLQMYGEGVS